MRVEQDIPLVLALDDASTTLEQVGGKGASLARLAAAGLPVPRGFHITTAAYRRFVEENGLQEQILAAVSAVSADDEEPVPVDKRTAAVLTQAIKAYEARLFDGVGHLAPSALPHFLTPLDKGTWVLWPSLSAACERIVMAKRQGVMSL